jgi:hypothetical protein
MRWEFVPLTVMVPVLCVNPPVVPVPNTILEDAPNVYDPEALGALNVPLEDMVKIAFWLHVHAVFPPNTPPELTVTAPLNT